MLPSSGSRAGALTAAAAEVLGIPAGRAGRGRCRRHRGGRPRVRPGRSWDRAAGDRHGCSDRDALRATHRRHGRSRHALLPCRHRPRSLPDGRGPQRWPRPAVGLRHAERLVGRALRLGGAVATGATTLCSCPTSAASGRHTWTPRCAAPGPVWLPQHTRTDLLRSALEGVAFAAAEALEALFPAGAAVDHLRLAGGGTAAPAWRQLLADALDVELRAVAVPGASGRGAAFLGARAAGLIDESVLAGDGDPGGHLGGAPRTRGRRPLPRPTHEVPAHGRAPAIRLPVLTPFARLTRPCPQLMRWVPRRPSEPAKGSGPQQGGVSRMTQPILEARGLSRSFGHVRALTGADFDV